MPLPTQRTGVFGRLQTYATLPTSMPALTRAANMPELPGFGAVVRLSSEGGLTVVLSLWRSREDAELLEERLPPIVPRADEDETYELDDTIVGCAAGEPTVAFLGRFNGPLSPAQLAAARRRGNESMAPRLSQVPGLVRVLIFWHPVHRSMVVLHLAETRDALRRVTDVVARTPLGPDDDPTLLSGPDRIGLNHVDQYAWSLTGRTLHHA